MRVDYSNDYHNLLFADSQGSIRDVAKYNGGTTNVVDHLQYGSFGSQKTDKFKQLASFFMSTASPRLFGSATIHRRFYLVQAPAWERTARVGLLVQLLANLSAIAKNFLKKRNPRPQSESQRASRKNLVPQPLDAPILATK
jgi:hypothetical protein